MKTTVDIADDLLLRAKEEARASETTLRGLIEMGLRLVLERRADSKEIRIRPVTVGGRGLQPEFRDGSWESLRSAIYEDRAE